MCGPTGQHVLHPVSSHIYEGNATFAVVIRDASNPPFFFFPPPRPRGVRRLINRSFHLIYDKYLHTYRKPLIVTILSRFSDGCSHDYHHPFSSSFNCTLVTDRIFDDPLTHLKNGVRGNLSRQRGPLFQCDNGQLDGWDERESE